MLKKIFSQHKTSHIAVVQYSRPAAGCFDPSNPKHVSGFHLALVAIEEDKSGREWRMLWQATNRPVPAQGDIPAHVEWSLDIREHINVGNSKLCLGGVIIGELKKDDINALKLVIEETAVQVDGKLHLNHERSGIQLSEVDGNGHHSETDPSRVGLTQYR